MWCITQLILKGTFYSESAGEMWNRHVKVPKNVPGLLIPVRIMKCCNKMTILTFWGIVTFWNQRLNLKVNIGVNHMAMIWLGWMCWYQQKKRAIAGGDPK